MMKTHFGIQNWEYWGRNVTIRNTATIHIGLVGVFLAACQPGSGVMPQTSAIAVDDATEQASTAPVAEETIQPVEAPPLIYSWDTGFSAFLTPPIEIRRLARDDCRAAGYEVASMGTMALDGSTATATFICRGDFE
jgi:hypothetical protein